MPRKKATSKKPAKKAGKQKPVKKTTKDAEKPSGVVKKPVQRKRKKFYFEPFPLLDLPSDIRDEVLRCLLTQDEPLLSVPKGKDYIKNGSDMDFERAFVHRYYKLDPAILRACKQLYDEGSRILYKENTFAITAPFNFPEASGCCYPSDESMHDVFVLNHRRLEALFNQYPKLREAVKWNVHVYVGDLPYSPVDRESLRRVLTAARGLQQVVELRQLTLTWLDEDKVIRAPPRGTSEPAPPKSEEEKMYPKIEALQAVVNCFRHLEAGTFRVETEKDIEGIEGIDTSHSTNHNVGNSSSGLCYTTDRIEEIPSSADEAESFKGSSSGDSEQLKQPAIKSGGIKKSGAAKTVTKKAAKSDGAKESAATSTTTKRAVRAGCVKKPAAKAATKKAGTKTTAKAKAKAKAPAADSRIIREKVTRLQKKLQGEGI